MKEVKSSLGSAVKTLRGNMVIRLEMMLEMPTASESSISILKMKNTQNRIFKTKVSENHHPEFRSKKVSFLLIRKGQRIPFFVNV